MDTGTSKTRERNRLFLATVLCLPRTKRSPFPLSFLKMSLALRKRMEREYGRGKQPKQSLLTSGPGSKRKRRKYVRDTERGSGRVASPNNGTTKTQKKAKRRRPGFGGLSQIRSMLGVTENKTRKTRAQLPDEKERNRAGGSSSVVRQKKKQNQQPKRPGSAPGVQTSNSDSLSRGRSHKTVPPQRKTRSKSPSKRGRAVAAKFRPLLGGVNAGSVVMRRRLESEYGFRAKHKLKMGYFSYKADAEGTESAMAVVEQAEEETQAEKKKREKREQEAQAKAKARADARQLMGDLSRQKPDTTFLTRLLSSTMSHNKRVLEEMKTLESEIDKEDAKSGNAVHIAKLSELVRMFLEGNGDSSSSVGRSKTKPRAPVSRLASALFGLGQGTATQKRLRKQYGIGN
jgi:hypothetical protein